MFYLIFISVLASLNTAFGQGSPGPIPQQGDYPLGNGINSVMQQATWLSHNTTFDQQINAVTQDALQLHSFVIPPVTSSGDPNIYTSSGTPFVTPSPGPISSSSTSSGGGSSSGAFPGNDGDIIMWISSDTTTVSNIITNMVDGALNPTCISDATNKGLPNPTSARAIIEQDSTTMRCHQIFDGLFPPSTAVFTPKLNGYEEIHSGSFASMFDPGVGPTQTINSIDGTEPVWHFMFTGCAQNRTLPSDPASNCQYWTDGTPSSYFESTHTNVGAQFDRGNGGNQCNWTLTPYHWYCGISYNSGSTSSTSSSSTSTTGGPVNGDHLIWVSVSDSLSNISAGGGGNYMDGECRTEALARGWPGANTAKALANVDGSGCHRGFSGGVNTWTPLAPNSFTVIGDSITQVFLNNPNPMPNDRFGFQSTLSKFTGCISQGGPSSNSCTNFTNPNSGSYYWGNYDSLSWISGGVNNCTPLTNLPWYCALEWAGTSSSSSSSSSSSTSSTGFPGNGSDHVIWAEGHVSGIAGIRMVGVSGMNQQCVTSAANAGWANAANAKALIHTGGVACKDQFSGGTAVYTIQASGSFNQIYSGTIESMFANGFNGMIRYQANGNLHNNKRATGCDIYGNAVQNCNDWTSVTMQNQWTEGSNVGVGTPLSGNNWLNINTNSCYHFEPAFNYGWYCGMKWAP